MGPRWWAPPARLQLTCAINGANWTLGLDIDAYVPPGANETAVQVRGRLSTRT